jgi:2-amino-4-hydroxy-6-hydroxymethyldihydropteridine diphosphokinase
MAIVYLGLGSNLGDKAGNLFFAVEEIEQRIGRVLVKSNTIETESWGFVSKNRFMNMALCVETDLSPMDLLTICNEIEQGAGRIQKSCCAIYADRTLDVDILYYDKEIIRTEKLTIPHPHIAERDFVLIPMNEIAPDFEDPATRKTIAQMLEEKETERDLLL